MKPHEIRIPTGSKRGGRQHSTRWGGREHILHSRPSSEITRSSAERRSNTPMTDRKGSDRVYRLFHSPQIVSVGLDGISPDNSPDLHSVRGVSPEQLCVSSPARHVDNLRRVQILTIPPHCVECSSNVWPSRTNQRLYVSCATQRDRCWVKSPGYGLVVGNEVEKAYEIYSLVKSSGLIESTRNLLSDREQGRRSIHTRCSGVIRWTVSIAIPVGFLLASL